MSRIRILTDQLANQIAAGEVIERPVAVVKELVENSLDAGATRVEVVFKRGGKTLVRVEDNGFGMSADDALLALERHATSKLASAEDLHDIRSFGFRGEALPSVASVSRFMLRTRREQDDAGCELLINAGKILHHKACGMPCGTVISVEHLFNSVPARRKFLKTDKTESAHIVHCVRLFALAHPQVAFTLIEDERVVFRSPASVDLLERVGAVWNRGLVDDLFALDSFKGEGMSLSGAILRQNAQGRSSRQDIQCFVNRRPVDSRTLAYGVLEAYQSYLPRGRFPAAFLFLEIPPASVDVNVHPAKREVRFRDEGQVRRFVVRALSEALHPKERPVAEVSEEVSDAVNESVGVFEAHTSAQAKSVAAALQERHFPVKNPPSAFTEQDNRPISKPEATPEEVKARFDWRYCGMLNKPRALALFESPAGLVLLHCRAAHERIEYERLCALFAKEQSVSQPLLMPITLEFDPVAAAALEPHVDTLKAWGLDLVLFGRNFYRLEAFPAWLPASGAEAWVRVLVEEIRAGGLTQGSRLAHEKVALLAATRAVRMDDALNEVFCRHLAEALLLCEQPLTCPRGRPTLLEWSAGELVKKFGLSFAPSDIKKDWF